MKILMISIMVLQLLIGSLQANAHMAAHTGESVSAHFHLTKPAHESADRQHDKHQQGDHHAIHQPLADDHEGDPHVHLSPMLQLQEMLLASNGPTTFATTLIAPRWRGPQLAPPVPPPTA